MSIRFKFRSSVNFDSVDIEGRSSISVGDLRSKIVLHKHLNICQDFDLVFSDALTAHEFHDENFQIPSGSSVIIKRVPAGSVPSAMAPINSVENLGAKDSNPVNPIGYFPLNAETDNFDDFGVDLCPIPEAALSDSDLEFDKNYCISNEKPKNALASRVGCQVFEASDLSEAIPRGPNHNVTERNTSQTKVELNGEEPMKLEKMVANCPAVQNDDFPSELKCSLCNTFFKEAVMIPCCQHSFCEKCIRAVIQEKAKCPKCYSSKCKVEDLLPNLSLRQAIEHFLESQILMSDADNALHKYAPDGESGIQAKDFSCAVTILQREPNMPLSPSATEKGSNQIMTESVYESRIKKNVSLGGSGSHTSNLGSSKALKSAPLSHKLKQTDGERVGYAHHEVFRSGDDSEACPDFQGESQPHNFPQSHVHEEVDFTINKKRGLWVNTGGGDRNFMATGRHKKGDRTCYMCGSPDHFIRDCPAASSPYPMLQTGNSMFPGAMSGYASPFWNSNPLPPIRPFTNMYGNSGMMPFNSGMVPSSPFAVPPYMPSMYGGLPVPSGFMRMGGMLAPQVQTGSERPLTHSENMQLRDCENRWKLSNENLGRRQSYDDEDDGYNKRYHCNVPERSHEFKSRVEREKSASYSEDSFPRVSQRKYRHDKHVDHDSHAVDERHEKNLCSTIAGRDRSDRKPYHRERSNSGVEDMPNSSDRRSEERHKHPRRSSKQRESKGKCGSDSSRSHHQTKKERDYGGKRVESDIEPNRKHHSHSGSGLEPCSSVDQKKQYKDKDPSHTSRHSRRNTKPSSDDMCNDRWQMASGSEEDYGEGYRYRKRKRVH
ncbi:E3 ubiquitin ligase PARAQUAT TOLERANCE 3-like isoform X2 [Camellia sinensis]|uniref:E3 ubiquitin ligase PARAQUAT TOLERANCE 3-like isoform X2 n=1 Tax=Camellia sinensis TaxID=4442 RepID=UPI001036A23E|nr:E3 ubiquitin ligase PARAQUAT TOLERANCE 3-like isoform X2 [Camellia sinensis]